MGELVIAHASDLHYCEKHLEWVDQAVGAFVDGAIEQGAAVAILSGDSFDHQVHVHEPAAHAFLAQVRRLADAMPVLVLQGTFSHDRPGSLNILRTLGGRHPVHVADRIHQVALVGGAWVASDGFRFEPDQLDRPDGVSAPRLVVSCLPSIHRGAIVAAAGKEDADAGALIEQVCQGWAEPNRKAQALGVPTVLTAHGTVNGAVTESRFAMVSPDHEFSPGALFAAEASAGMVGHIHAHNAWEHQGRRIAYPGSITRLVHGHDEPTFWLLWTVRPDSADFQPVPTPARELVAVTFDGPPDLEQLRQIADQVKGAHVRVRWSVDEEHRDAVDVEAIRQVLAGAAELKLEGRINPVQRTRAQGISQADSLADKLGRWGEVTETETGPLLERLQDLQALEADAIVDKYKGVGNAAA